MTKTKKKRKGPSESAKKFALGERKRGNDRNIWEIIQTKNGIKRWKRLGPRQTTSRLTRRKTKKRKRKRLSKRLEKLSANPTSSFNKNMRLQKFWQKLAGGKLIVLVFKNGTSQYKYMTKKTNAARGKEWRSVEEAATQNPDVVAILVSNSSWEAYDYLYARAKNKSVKDVIKNWKKYFRTSSGKNSPGDKTMYPY
jgi:hypothetical protein